jgi:hypothetical protein
MKMRYLIFKSLPIIASSLLLLGCNSTPETYASNIGMDIPIWVTNPTVEKGIAASSCVLASNSFSIDKSQAASIARIELAKNLQTRVANMQEEYTKKVTSMGEAFDKSTFKQTSIELTDQHLQGSRIDKVDYAQMGENRNLCVLVTISEKDSKNLFAQLLEQAPIKLAPDNETLLYLNFIQAENNTK